MTAGNRHGTGLLEYTQPGAAVRIAASPRDGEPVIYDAMPKNSWGLDSIGRRMTSNRSIRAGVWRWPDPPDTPHVVLYPGLNTVVLEVTTVEPPLVGEAVRLRVHAPLGFKSSMPNVEWLWLWFLWPIGALFQICWAIAIFVTGWSKNRGKKPVQPTTANGGVQVTDGGSCRPVVRGRTWSSPLRASRNFVQLSR